MPTRVPTVLHVATECAPLAKSGGLADVVGALPRELERTGRVRCAVLLPRYAHLEDLPGEEVLAGFTYLGWEKRAWTIERLTTGGPLLADGAASTYVVRSSAYAEPGLYGPTVDFERQAVLSHAAESFAHATRGGRLPLPPVDLVHVHDHHPALAVLRLRHAATTQRIKTILTVHNARYHGAHPWWAVEGAGLPPTLFRGDCDHGGTFNSLKAAVGAADFVTTVSPTHARDLVDDPDSSGGLDYAFRQVEDRLVGILNGIDLESWDPARDPALPVPFHADDPSGKEAAKEAICAENDLDPARPLLAFVGRLVPEKGVDVLLEALGRIVTREPRPQVVVLGSGSPRFEDALARLERTHGSSLRVATRLDEALARRLYAGADVLLMPSWFEPCGLAQMYAMRYGTVPVVYPTGGLADSVTPFDARTGMGTGAWMERHDARALAAAVHRVLGWWRQPAVWRILQRNGMTANLSWDQAARGYLDVYERALA